jgi:hypothetical protein
MTVIENGGCIIGNLPLATIKYKLKIIGSTGFSSPLVSGGKIGKNGGKYRSDIDHGNKIVNFINLTHFTQIANFQRLRNQISLIIPDVSQLSSRQNKIRQMNRIVAAHALVKIVNHRQNLLFLIGIGHSLRPDKNAAQKGHYQDYMSHF